MTVSDALLDQLEFDRSLDDPARLRERLDALDCLDTEVGGGPGPPRVEAIRARLEAINEKLYEQVRDAVRRGEGVAALSAWMAAPADDVAEGYDYLDELVSGILRFGPPDDAAVQRSPDMVFYQPTPARHVFDLLRRVELTAHDVLVDLGAGLGHVSLLAAICSDASCIGIEHEAAYVACFRRSAGALRVSRAVCVHQDARVADFSAGTVFYLYTPFTGPVLRNVLDRLHREAADRPIRIVTLGPCTRTVAGESWLETVDAVDVRRITVFRSRR